MRLAFALVLLACCAHAQDVGISIANAQTSGAATFPFQFPDTPEGEASSVVLRLHDATQAPMQIVSVIIGSSSGSTLANGNFTITGMIIDKTLSPSTASFEDITVSFAPIVQGAISGYITVVYELQQNGCLLGSGTAGTECPALTIDAGTLQGNATAPALVLRYAGPNGSTQLQPFSSTPLNFGNVSTSTTEPIVFTLTNASATTSNTPPVALLTAVYSSSAFALDTSNLPAALPAGGSGTFTVTFAPGQVAQAAATLTLGTLDYPLVGTGIVVADIDALQISYVDAQGVRTLPQAATPISFGQVVAGTNARSVLTFTVANPLISLNAVQLNTLAITGTGFGAAGFPALPVTIAPGQSFTFTATFAPGTKGRYTGALSIGTRVFALMGSSISSTIPDATLQVDQQSLTSEMQAHLSIQLASSASDTVVGQLTMAFVPSVTNVADDPAVLFLAVNGRQMQVTVAAGTQNGTFNGQTALTFQTGTTAGTITFTLTFPNKAPITQSFTIAPEKVQISSATAIRQAPYVVITLNGFDNTYSAGKLSFSFNDLNGHPLTPTPILVDSSADFSRYFFQNDTAGGAFALQAKFPVTGDTAQVGSVTVQMTNSSGTSTVSEVFQ